MKVNENRFFGDCAYEYIHNNEQVAMTDIEVPPDFPEAGEDRASDYFER